VVAHSQLVVAHSALKHVVLKMWEGRVSLLHTAVCPAQCLLSKLPSLSVHTPNLCFADVKHKFPTKQICPGLTSGICWNCITVICFYTDEVGCSTHHTHTFYLTACHLTTSTHLCQTHLRTPLSAYLIAWCLAISHSPVSNSPAHTTIRLPYSLVPGNLTLTCI